MPKDVGYGKKGGKKDGGKKSGGTGGPMIVPFTTK